MRWIQFEGITFNLSKVIALKVSPLGLIDPPEDHIILAVIGDSNSKADNSFRVGDAKPKDDREEEIRNIISGAYDIECAPIPIAVEPT